MKPMMFALLAAATTLPVAAQAQGQTRTLDDLRAEYRAQCGKNGSRERLLVAYDRAIRLATGPAGRKQLAAQRAAVANPREPVCPEPPGPLAAGATAAPPADDEAMAEDVCKRPPPNPRQCRQFRLLLGRWTARKQGGVIETVLTPGGTITATILADNAWMKRNGYRSGMVVMRGWTPAMSGGTWIVVARTGQVFLSNVYGREVKAAWSPGGIIHIAKDSPDTLAFPSGLALRLADTDPWVRVGDPR